MKRLIAVACSAGVVAACAPAATSSATPTATGSGAPLVVYTKWVADPRVGTGAEPGFKPALTGLTSHNIQSANVSIDPSGTLWLINVKFTAHGAEMFRQLTHDAVLACGNQLADCPQRHIAIWLDLTQADIDHWDDSVYAARVSEAYDLTCLGQPAGTGECPKLLSDPVVLQEIDGGSAEIVGGFTQQTAADVAKAINSTSHE